MAKTITVVLLLIAVCYLGYRFVPIRFNNRSAISIRFDSVQVLQPINVFFYQDVSGSIAVNGVELVEAKVFGPYLTETRRDIQLSFGIISDRTARQPITIELPAFRLRKPILPDWDTIPANVRNALKKTALALCGKYAADSAAYFKNRAARFGEFCRKVDEAVAPYRGALSASTDLSPAIRIADKTFNYCFAGSEVTNFLLLNSDGQDSRRRTPDGLTNRAEVVLINANGSDSSNLNGIVTRYFRSPEQAIEFSLNAQKP